MGLLLPGEEDRMVDVTKRVNPAERDRGNLRCAHLNGRVRGGGGPLPCSRQLRGRGGVAVDGYGVNSFPRTSSYSFGTNAHTSSAMNFTYRCCSCQTLTIKGSG